MLQSDERARKVRKFLVPVSHKMLCLFEMQVGPLSSLRFSILNLNNP